MVQAAGLTGLVYSWSEIEIVVFVYSVCVEGLRGVRGRGAWQDGRGCQTCL